MTIHTFLGTVVRACILSAGVLANELSAQTTSPAASPWYRRSRTLDITGSNPRDSIVLTATGKRGDSLAIAMTFYVAGSMVHRQKWTSEDELADADSLRASPARLAAFMRERLDTVLLLVKRERINAEQVRHMGDVTLLGKIVPAPTHQISLSFGFENSLYFVWNTTSRRLTLFMECC
jgi:hypothetical protein